MHELNPRSLSTRLGCVLVVHSLKNELTNNLKFDITRTRVHMTSSTLKETQVCLCMWCGNGKLTF